MYLVVQKYVISQPGRKLQKKALFLVSPLHLGSPLAKYVLSLFGLIHNIDFS